MARGQVADFRCLRAVMRQNIPRTGITADELFDAVRHDYGSCDERRLYRALKKLRDWKEIEMSGVDEFERPVYRFRRWR